MSVIVSNAEEISKSPINFSKSKQLYSFSKSKRFSNLKTNKQPSNTAPATNSTKSHLHSIKDAPLSELEAEHHSQKQDVQSSASV
jgi:hypothetical protein